MNQTTEKWRALRKTIGQNIHSLRLKKNLPLKKLSVASGIAGDVIDYYELGKGEPDMQSLLKISHALEVDISKLIES